MNWRALRWLLEFLALVGLAAVLVAHWGLSWWALVAAVLMLILLALLIAAFHYAVHFMDGF